MPRYDFTAQRILTRTEQMLKGGYDARAPCWLEVLRANPPSQNNTRPPALQHSEQPKRRTKKASKGVFKPQPIQYIEDDLRKRFFKDHPWELARPRIVLENESLDAMETWDSIRQEGRQLNGESVVQRQLYLMDNHSLTQEQAYDQARTELYDERLREDIERRVAREEATHVGATFGKDRNTIGMELEDKSFEDWRAWADKFVTERDQMRVANTSDPTAAPEVSGQQEQELIEAGEVPVTVAGSQDAPPRVGV